MNFINKRFAINRFARLMLGMYIVAFFVMGCAKTDVAIAPISANEAARNLGLRDKYESLLFNHLIVRGELPMKSRYESIQNMAKDGFKPAALALALYDIEHTDLKTNDNKAEKALDNLAESGDVTAQCLYAIYWKPEEKPKYWRNYVISAANAEVAKCMFLRARYVEKDKSKEQLDWTYKAAVKGDSSGQSLIAFAYLHGEVIPKNLKNAMCWAIEAKKTGSAIDHGIYQTIMNHYQEEKQDITAPLPNPQFCESVIK